MSSADEAAGFRSRRVDDFPSDHLVDLGFVPAEFPQELATIGSQSGNSGFGAGSQLIEHDGLAHEVLGRVPAST